MRLVSGAAQPCERTTNALDAIHAAVVSCDRCPRLREYCARVAREKRRAFKDETYWGRAVPGFGDPDARLLLVGLAPAAHGANRTGRVFTGDGSGDFLMAALYRAGLASRATSRRADDGLQLHDVYITAAVHCAPPDNKPSPGELANCLTYLDAELTALRRVKVVVALGRIAFDACLRVLKRREVIIRPRPAFGHGVVHRLPGGLALVGCFHPSRQNTNTGRLTARMMDAALRRALRILK